MGYRFFLGPCRLLPIFLCLPVAALSQTQNAASVRIIEDVPHTVFLAAGDLNGDGGVDLALAEATFPRDPTKGKPIFRVNLLYQKAGGFALPPDMSVELPAAPSGLVMGDFDRDGRNDLAVGLRSQRSLALYLGSEGFAKAHLSQYNNDSGAGGLCVGHISREGGVDFMTGSAWRKWSPRDQFACGYFCGPERNDNRRSTLADLDRDGTDDLIFTTYWAPRTPKGSNNLIRLYYGPFLRVGLVGPSAAAEVLTLTSPFADSDQQAQGQVFAGDLNGDWQPDIIVGAPNQTLVYFQNSPTGFCDQAGPSLVLEGVTPWLAEDLDADGLCDLVLRHTDANALSIWHQRKATPLTAKWRALSTTVTLQRAIVTMAAGAMDGHRKRTLFVALAHGGLAIVSPSPR